MNEMKVLYFILLLATVFQVEALENVGDWNFVGKSDHSTLIKFDIALIEPNIADVCGDENSLIWKLSDPFSDIYGNWLSKDEVYDLLSPAKDDIEKIESWLLENGIQSNEFEIVGSNVHVETSIEKASNLFGGVFFYEYQMIIRNSKKINIHRIVEEYIIPNNILILIDVIFGISEFPTLKDFISSSSSSIVSDSDYSNVKVPQYVYKQYNISLETLESSPNIVMLEFGLGVYGDPYIDDLDDFLNDNGFPKVNVDHKDPWKPGGSSDSATADLAYVATVGSGADILIITSESQDWIYEAMQNLLKLDPIPQVVLVGWDGPEDIQYINPQNWGPDRYISRSSEEICKLGLLGVSVVTTAGACGVYGVEGCVGDEYPFSPIFPADCPYITSVGITMTTSTDLNHHHHHQPMKTMESMKGRIFVEKSEVIPPMSPLCSTYQCENPGHNEIVCSVQSNSTVTSGGGFSNFISRSQAAYQKDFVDNYLQTAKLPNETRFNSSGRAYPDVSLNSGPYLFKCTHECDHDVDENGYAVGISDGIASAIFSGIVLRLADYRLAQKLPSLGPLNPLLYQMAKLDPDTFNDITIGNNRCNSHNNGGCEGCTEGFNAFKGWDPSTGLGTPNVGKMMDYLKQLK